MYKFLWGKVKQPVNFIGAPGTGPGPGGSWPAGTYPGII